MQDIKIYEILIDENNEDHGIMRNSFVDYPAVEYTKLNFSKETNKLAFTANDSEQRFMSVSMIADTPIPRINELTGELYGIVFTKSEIKKIVNKFIMDGNFNEVSLQHTSEMVDGVYLVEHFITREGVTECPAFKDLPEGSYVTTYYVPNKEQYEALKADKDFNGFSIEINGMMEEMLFSQEHSMLEEKIKVILNSDLNDEQKEIKVKDILNIK
ncbi:MAG: Unknown protein [uncultured Sulfurovum sp.]|uniref:Uncharacterized protein n=1 Tax=uncultured Sulfurovum sp. TaxID=269237 RepID=A0A6S6SWN5_9BACT|nr:MAG: Unknown protein [uncultured Sulfurovum sp.]